MAKGMIAFARHRMTRRNAGARAGKLDELVGVGHVDRDDPAWHREVQDLLAQSRAFDRVTRRSQRCFGEWVPGSDAETAARVAARLRETIRRGEPSSFIRLGDGEGKVLAFGTLDYPNLTRSALERLSYLYFGTSNPLTRHCDELREGLLASIAGATFVGIPTGWRLKYQRDKVLEEVRCAEELLGVWTVTQLVLKQKRRLHLRTKKAASSTFHKFVLEHIPSLVSGRRIGLITCHRNLVDAFRDRFDTRVVDYHAVPPPVYFLPAHERHDNGHFPGRYRELLNDLHSVQAGVLYIVAAGMPGKVYCETVRRHGGIAFDIGHSMDVLAGVRGRKNITGDMVNKYQIVERPSVLVHGGREKSPGQPLGGRALPRSDDR